MSFPKDTEPPTCHYCPSNIVLHNATSATIRVNWAAPNCSDNSGLPPTIKGNRNRGDQFGVPGKYEINYEVTDNDGNEGNCTFTIDLARKYILLPSKSSTPRTSLLITLFSSSLYSS